MKYFLKWVMFLYGTTVGFLILIFGTIGGSSTFDGISAILLGAFLVSVSMWVLNK